MTKEQKEKLFQAIKDMIESLEPLEKEYSCDINQSIEKLTKAAELPVCKWVNSKTVFSFYKTSCNRDIKLPLIVEESTRDFLSGYQRYFQFFSAFEFCPFCGRKILIIKENEEE